MKNNLAPKIRFRGFTGAWEHCKLSEISKISTGFPFDSNDFNNNGEYLVITNGNIQTDKYEVINTIGNRINLKNENFKKYILNKNDILITMDGTVGRTAKVMRNNLILAQRVGRITNCKNQDYVYYLLNTGDFYNKMINLSHGGTIKHISLLEIENYELCLSLNELEQNKIATLLSALDQLIILYDRKCYKMKELKKTLYEKMFPQNNSLYPEIRFRGFTDAWEQHRFDELALTERGLTYSPNDVCQNGIRVLRSSNINEDQFKIQEDDVFVNKNVININYAKNNDILITSANGSTRLVGKHALIQGIKDNSVVHGGFMLLARPYKFPDFLNALMSSNWYKKFIELYVAGGNGSIGNISKTDLDRQIIYVPSNNECELIGRMFKSIDNLIILYQHKYEKLKKIKQSLLNDMFT